MTEEIMQDEPVDENEVEEISVTTPESSEKNSKKKDISNLSDQEIDEIADTAIETLQGILKYFDLGDITIDEYEGDEGELILDITGDDLAILIGRHGKNLDALQLIVSSITYHKLTFRYPLVIDVEGYKARQRAKIESIAKTAANRAVSQGRAVRLRPMNPYERRIVHITLRNDSRVTTQSEGDGDSRRVVVDIQ